MRKFLTILAAALALSLPSIAFASCNGQFQSGYLCGNASGGPADPFANPMSAYLDQLGAVQGSILNRGSSTWNSTVAPVLGNPGSSQGSLGFAGSGSGVVTVQAQAAAGTWTFKLPTNSGTATYVLTTDGSGNTSWTNPAAGGTVTSVGLALPAAVFSVSGSPVTSSGTLTGSFQTQSSNTVFSGPTTGASATPTFRALVGADLPNPSTSSLGGIQAINAVSHQWISSISTSGIPALTQPAFADISGSIALSQIAPSSNNTALSNISGVSATPLANTITSIIDTFGATQGDVLYRGASAWAALAPGTNGQVLTSGGASANPSWTTINASNLLDTINNVQGDILYRGASGWVVLAPGTNGFVLTTGGASANPSWANPTTGGTVTSITAGTGLSGGTITTTGTIALANIATGNVLANVSGISAAPSATAPTAVLDVIGSTQGNILYRGASNWAALATGTSGQFLQTTGAGSTPQWASIASNLIAGTGISISGTTTATISNTGLTNALVALSGGGTAYGTCSSTTAINCTLASPGGFLNVLRNASMSAWFHGGVAAPITETTAGGWCAEGVWVIPTGASVTCSQLTSQSNAAPLYSMKVTGATSVTDLIERFVVESNQSAMLSTQTVTFHFYWVNSTGGTVTPTLQTKYTTTSADNWGSPVIDLAATSMQSCANATACHEAYTLNVSNNAVFGYEFNVDFGNNFSTSGKTMTLLYFDARITPGVSTGINNTYPPAELRDMESDIRWSERFYQTSYDNFVAPGAATHVGMVNGGQNCSPAPFCTQGWVGFRTTMRCTPTVSIWDGAGTPNKMGVTAGGSSTTITDGQTPALTAGLISSKGYAFSVVGNTAVGYTHYAADCTVSGG